MYASSFLLTLERVDETLDQALALETFRQREPVLRIVDDAVAAIDDVGELATVGLRHTCIDAVDQSEGDDAVTAILEARADEGFDAELPEPALDEARAAGRVHDVGDTVLVPVDRELPGVRNWWLLTELLVGWLGELVDGFRRVYRRTQVDSSARVETAVWTVVERVDALYDAIVQARTRGTYTAQSVQQETAKLVDDVGRLTTTITGGDNA